MRETSGRQRESADDSNAKNITIGVSTIHWISSRSLIFCSNTTMATRNLVIEATIYLLLIAFVGASNGGDDEGGSDDAVNATLNSLTYTPNPLPARTPLQVCWNVTYATESAGGALSSDFIVFACLVTQTILFCNRLGRGFPLYIE